MIRRMTGYREGGKVVAGRDGLTSPHGGDGLTRRTPGRDSVPDDSGWPRPGCIGPMAGSDSGGNFAGFRARTAGGTRGGAGTPVRAGGSIGAGARITPDSFGFGEGDGAQCRRGDFGAPGGPSARRSGVPSHPRGPFRASSRRLPGRRGRRLRGPAERDGRAGWRGRRGPADGEGSAVGRRAANRDKSPVADWGGPGLAVQPPPGVV